MTAALMIQGTGSDVGKSLIVAGLARAFARRGLAVRPFKPQNMSNNAAVTVEGGEIGRAQALQALACGVPASIDMNPVLLKPETDIGAQVVVRGQRVATSTARDYQTLRAELLPAVLESFDRLKRQADLVLVEGAGSPAEINLRANDIANMGFAEAADLPVLLVADIHRGGVIASLVGTFDILPPADSERIAAFLVNKFHGDPSLFADGVSYLEERTGRPCAGVVPHFPDAARLPAEDAVALENAGRLGTGAITIAVPRLPRIANFDDLDPLKLEPDVTLVMVQPGEPLPADADLVLLPGSKSTVGDLKALREEGWDIDLKAHIRRGGHVLGLCGGYQMLGRAIHDPDGIEGPAESVAGLGLLDIETTLTPDKALVSVTGRHCATGEPLAGYEMHIGRTEGPDRDRPFAMLDPHADGAVSADGRVAGSYLHGLFASDGFRRAFLARLGARTLSDLSHGAEVERTLDALADHLEAHIDLDLLHAVAKGEGPARPAAPHFDAAFSDRLDLLIHWRRDVRRFRTDPVDDGLVAHLLALADEAPSVGLSQPWRFVAMETPEARARILASFERCNAEALGAYGGETAALYARLKLEGLREAPVQFAVFADETTAKGKGLGRQTMAETLRYSAVCAVHTLWLAARARGLGVGWVSILDPDEVRAAAGAPEDWTLVAYLCIGWPSEEHETPELERAGWERREHRAASGEPGR